MTPEEMSSVPNKMTEYEEMECLCGDPDISDLNMCRYHNECGVCPYKGFCECENYNCIICLKVVDNDSRRIPS